MHVVGKDQYKDEDLRCQEVLVFVKISCFGVTIIDEDAEPDEETGDHKFNAVDQVKLQETLPEREELVDI